MGEEADALNDQYDITDRQFWDDMDPQDKADYNHSFQNYKAGIRRDSPRQNQNAENRYGHYPKRKKGKKKHRSSRYGRSCNYTEVDTERYSFNKSALNGAILQCPVCKCGFTKKSYQQAFCSTKCKDDYWNRKRSLEKLKLDMGIIHNNQ